LFWLLSAFSSSVASLLILDRQFRRSERTGRSDEYFRYISLFLHLLFCCIHSHFLFFSSRFRCLFILAPHLCDASHSTLRDMHYITFKFFLRYDAVILIFYSDIILQLMHSVPVVTTVLFCWKFICSFLSTIHLMFWKLHHWWYSFSLHSTLIQWHSFCCWWYYGISLFYISLLLIHSVFLQLCNTVPVLMGYISITVFRVVVIPWWWAFFLLFMYLMVSCSLILTDVDWYLLHFVLIHSLLFHILLCSSFHSVDVDAKCWSY
jgi:hypothetical protein